MTTKRTRSSFQRRDRTGDDFTVIDGITKGSEAKLHKARILTYAQLAALSAREIVEAAGASDGLTVERVGREDWPGHARRLAGLKTRAQFLLQLVLNDDRTVSSVKVTHSESGEESEWVGWHEDRLLHFLRRQGGLAHPSPSAEPAEAEPSGDQDTIEPVAVGEAAPALTAFVPVDRDGASEAEPRLREFRALRRSTDGACVVVAPEHPFDVRLAFDVAQAERTARSFDYTTLIYANALGQRQRRLVGQREGAAGEDGAVDLDVTAPGLPSGIYRMEADVVITRSAGDERQRQERRHRLKGSVLQVG